LKSILIFVVFGTPIAHISVFPTATGSMLHFLEFFPFYEKNLSAFNMDDQCPLKHNILPNLKLGRLITTPKKKPIDLKKKVNVSNLEIFSFQENTYISQIKLLTFNIHIQMLSKPFLM